MPLKVIEKIASFSLASDKARNLAREHKEKTGIEHAGGQWWNVLVSEELYTVLRFEREARVTKTLAEWQNGDADYDGYLSGETQDESDGWEDNRSGSEDDLNRANGENAGWQDGYDY